MEAFRRLEILWFLLMLVRAQYLLSIIFKISHRCFKMMLPFVSLIAAMRIHETNARRTSHQLIHLQPAYSNMMPAKTGPMTGYESKLALLPMMHTDGNLSQTPLTAARIHIERYRVLVSLSHISLSVPGTPDIVTDPTNAAINLVTTIVSKFCAIALGTKNMVNKNSDTMYTGRRP